MGMVMGGEGKVLLVAQEWVDAGPVLKGGSVTLKWIP